ncbi:uncharacterized protein LOC114841331 [Diachasma alloeum]|uniref:uncharacterized protein LOC114841331 n=1 Tax=Diachasma alloeum TaxID=454923 RepID=UPI0010FB4CA1|nr:uncharacterized protein LOC114841331 [Diachasma alloeum]
MDNFIPVLDTEDTVLIDYDESGQEIHYFYREADETIIPSPRFLEICREIQEAETECEEQGGTSREADRVNDSQTSRGMTHGDLQIGVIYISSTDIDSDSSSDESLQLSDSILRRLATLTKRRNGENDHPENDQKKRRMTAQKNSSMHSGLVTRSSIARRSVESKAQPSTLPARLPKSSARPLATVTAQSSACPYHTEPSVAAQAGPSISQTRSIHPGLDASVAKAGPSGSSAGVCRPLVKGVAGSSTSRAGAHQPLTKAASMTVTEARHPTASLRSSNPRARATGPSTSRAGARRSMAPAASGSSNHRAGANYTPPTTATGPSTSRAGASHPQAEAHRPSLGELYHEAVELRINLLLNNERTRLIELMDLVWDYAEFKRLQKLERE